MNKSQSILIVTVIALLGVAYYYSDQLKSWFDSLNVGGGSSDSSNSDNNPLKTADQTTPNISPVTPNATTSPASPNTFISLAQPSSLVGGSSRVMVSTDSGVKGFADIPNSTTAYTALVKNPTTNKIVGAVDVATKVYSSNDQIAVMTPKKSLTETLIPSQSKSLLKI